MTEPQEALRAALERFAPEHPWERDDHELAGEGDYVCVGGCRRTVEYDRSEPEWWTKEPPLDDHDADCAWVQAREALATPVERHAHVNGTEHTHAGLDATTLAYHLDRWHR